MFSRLLSFSPIKFNVFSQSLTASSLPLMISAADPGATMTFVAGGALKPIGGHILSHASATRMFLRKGKLHGSEYNLLPNALFRSPTPCLQILDSLTILYLLMSRYVGRAEERVAKLVDSPDKPESEASYKLDEGGWADV